MLEIPLNYYRQSYHWFWGLRQYAKPQPLSLGQQLELLSNQPQQLRFIITNVNAYLARPWWQRLVFRLFNIGNCAQDYHQLQAMNDCLNQPADSVPASLHPLKEELTPLFDYPSLPAFNLSNPLKSLWRWGKKRWAGRADTGSQQQADALVYPSAQSAAPLPPMGLDTAALTGSYALVALAENPRDTEPSPPAEPANTSDDNDTLVVTDELLPYLQRLNFPEISTGDELSLARIKRHYRANLRAFHSDKTGSDEQRTQLCLTLVAFKVIRHYIEHGYIAEELIDEWQQYINDEMDKLLAASPSAAEFWDKIIETYEAEIALAKECVQLSKEARQDIGEMRQDIRRMKEQLDQFEAELDARDRAAAMRRLPGRDDSENECRMDDEYAAAEAPSHNNPQPGQR